MENLRKETSAVPTGISNRSSSDLGMLGVSIYHLQSTFMAQLHRSNLNDGNPTIHQIEDLQGPPGIIRRRSARTVCPVDGRMGAAYVHTLSGEDHIGTATHMLSYCWSYKIGDILDSLQDFCETQKLEPKKTYIWIDCLCINQHRVVEEKETGGTGLMNFEQEFPLTLKRIGHMLAMMAPWQAPVYLTRLWCVFEMYAAHANGCTIDIVMPRREKETLENDVIEQGGGIGTLYEALGSTKVQNADTTMESDKHTILGLIESSVGSKGLNRVVNDLLRGWMKNVLMQLVEKRGNTNDLRYAIFCSRIGSIFRANGEYDGALEQYKQCLTIQISILGEHHLDTARTHSCIGLVLEDKGDLDGALEHHQLALSIQEDVRSKDQCSTATSYNNLGNALVRRGDYDGALEQFKKCLAIKEAVLAKDDPSTATTYGCIGTCLWHKGDYDGAFEKLQNCLAIREAVLGKEHPYTATTYHNIGNALGHNGDYEGALENCKKCLATREAMLGRDHPDTKKCLDDIHHWTAALKGPRRGYHPP